MFVVGGSKTLGRARLRASLVFARGVWLAVIDREGLKLDTRFAPPVKAAPRSSTCVYLLINGSFVTHGEARVSFRGPTAFAMSEQHLEGARGIRELTFETEGSPFTALEMHFSEADGPRAPAIPTRLAISDAWRGPAMRVLELANSPEADTAEEFRRAIGDTIGALAAAGVVTGRFAEQVLSPLPFERLLRAIRPLAERFALSATLDQIGASAETSPRQLDRYLQQFFQTFPMVGGTWRSATVHLRVKLAVLFLTAEGTPVSEVAQAVGYGSTEAMSRAFRDAGLPAPSVVREALLDAPTAT